MLKQLNKNKKVKNLSHNKQKKSLKIRVIQMKYRIRLTIGIMRGPRCHSPT